jgi:type VI secretion system protein ImpH
VASTSGPSEHPLIRALLAQPDRFSFFQAVSLLERSCPEAVAVGGGGPASKEALRFRPDVDLSFPPSSVSSVEWLGEPEGEERKDDRYRVTLTFLGLYGVDSPLPSHWSEDLLREVDRDTTVRDFLDLFHHRIYSLFYRTWTKYRYQALFRAGGGDTFTNRLFALLGLWPEEFRHDSNLPELRLLRYAGLFMQRPHSAAGLEVLLHDWLDGMPVRIASCTGRWMRLREGDCSRLGLGPTTLGEDLLLGDRVWDVSGGYTCELGPIDFSRYLRLLPGAQDHLTVDRLARLYVTDRLEAELEIRIKGESVPPLCLNSEDPPRLAWTTWIHSRPAADTSICFKLGGTS